MTHGDQPEDSGDQRPSAKVGGAALRPVLVSAVLHAAFLWLALPHASARGPEPRRIEWIDTSIDEGEKLTPAPRETGAIGPSRGPVPHATATGQRPASPVARAVPLPWLAAQAAEVGPALALDSDTAAAAPVVRGGSPQHAGGVSRYAATSPKPVYDAMARADGVPDGAGDGAGGGGGRGNDLTRVASLGGDRHWKCPFAFQGENADLDGSVVVHAKADVLPNGRPAKVFIMAAPSQGFANAAAKCALREMFVTALDANGDPVRGWTNRFRVVFTRK